MHRPQNRSFNLNENVIKMCFHESAVFLISEFFTYLFKVLPINTRGLGKISVHANVPDKCNLITAIVCRVEEFMSPVLINQNLNESCIFFTLA